MAKLFLCSKNRRAFWGRKDPWEKGVMGVLYMRLGKYMGTQGGHRGSFIILYEVCEMYGSWGVIGVVCMRFGNCMGT